MEEIFDQFPVLISGELRATVAGAGQDFQRHLHACFCSAVSSSVGDAASGAEQRDEVATSVAAPDADVVSIEIIYLHGGAQETDRGAAVIELRGEDCFLAQTVVDAREGEAMTGQKNSGAEFLAAGAPRAAVNSDDER